MAVTDPLPEQNDPDTPGLHAAEMDNPDTGGFDDYIDDPTDRDDPPVDEPDPYGGDEPTDYTPEVI